MINQEALVVMASSLVYSCGVVGLWAGLIAMVSRHPSFLRIVGSQARGTQALKVGVGVGVFLCLQNALFYFRPTPAPPLVVACYAGAPAGATAACLFSAYLLGTGRPWVLAALCLLAVPLGSWLRTLKRPVRLSSLAVMGGIGQVLSALVAGMPERAASRLATLSASQTQALFTLQTLLSVLLMGLTCWFIEYLAEEDERRSDRLVSQVVQLVDRISPSLADFPSLAFCHELQVASAARACLAFSPEGLLVDSSNSGHRLKLDSALFQELLEQSTPRVCDHQLLFDCPGCLCGEAVLLPLSNGSRLVGVVALLAARSHPLSSADQSLLKGMASLLSAQLVSQRGQAQQMLLEKTRFRFLTAQIKPHFLFNSLNTIAALIAARPQQAEELVLDLADFLQRSFAQEQDWVSIEEELKYVQAYLTIEKARFRDRLNFEILVQPPAAQRRVPSMILQPLVENAVRHGLAPQEQGGTVWIRIEALGETGVHICIRDDGQGCSPAEPDQFPRSLGTGVGLVNVKERLQSLCGGGAQFSWKSSVGVGTEVQISLA